jgi:serine/threonine-protein kinase
MSERFCPRDGTALRSSNPNADLVGTVIADRYHVIKKLGEGGMGTVYLAEHVKMGRKSALKVMNPGMAQDADAIARFNREASNASKLNHPNICAIYDFGETSDGLGSSWASR